MASNVSYNVNATRASLQSWLTVINSDFKACPANCTSAQTSLFRMRNPPPWLFVEVNESCVPLPFFSQQLTFQTSSNASVVYRLVGIIYLGGGHFASKLFDMDGSIWNYDGQNADGFATYGGTLINQSPLSFTQLNDKSLMCFHNCALVIAMRMIHVRSVHNDETAIMVEHHSLASRFKTELEAENSVLQSTRTARLDLAFHDNFGIMMDDDDVATVRVVGFVGRSKDMGPLANQWKATGEFSVSNIAKLRFNFPVVPPHHSLDRSLLDMHLQVSCALGDIVTRATKRLECQYPQGLSKVISWKTVDGYTLGTNNIFDDTEPLKTVKRYILTRHHKFLGTFVQFPQLFRLAIRDSGAIVSGSAALAFLMNGNAAWDPHDIDLYIPQNQYEVMMDHLTKIQGFVIDIPNSARANVQEETVLGMPDAAAVEEQTTTNEAPQAPAPAPVLQAQHANYALASKGIKSITKLRKDTVHLDVILATHADVLLPLAHFHSTLVMNFFTADAAACGFPDLTFKSRGIWNGSFKYLVGTSDPWVDRIVEKYKDRHFDIQSTYTWDGPCGSGCDVVHNVLGGKTTMFVNFGVGGSRHARGISGRNIRFSLGVECENVDVNSLDTCIVELS